MELACTGTNEITITGNIKTTGDYLAIRKMASDMVLGGAPALTLHINESLSMPSSVIGFFVKLANRDKVRLTMVIQDARLVELLEELNLSTVFGARRP